MENLLPKGVPGEQAAPTSIIIRAPNWLGDLLIGTSFLQAVLERFPEAPVDVIVPPAFAELPLPHRGRIMAFDRRGHSPGSFGRGLRGQGYSHFFVMPPSFSSAWMAFRSGVPNRIGYRGGFRSGLLRPALSHRHPPRSVHISREYLDLLRPWGDSEATLPTAHLPLPPGWVEAHLPPVLVAEAPYVVLAPGAEYGPAKQWPVAAYAACAAALHGRGWSVVVAGLEKDRPLGEAITDGLKGARNLCGETSLKGLTALIAKAALVISNDSGAMHLAAALGRPQIAIFGSTNPIWTAPLNPNAALISREEPCAPCYARTCPLGHTRCLNDLPAGEVIDKALEMLHTP